MRRRRRPGRSTRAASRPRCRAASGRHRAGADLEPAPAGRPLPRGQLGQLLLHAAVERPARGRGASSCPPTADAARRRRRGRRRRRRSPRSPAPTPARPGRCRRTSRSTTATRWRSRPKPVVPADPAVAHRRPRPHLLRRRPMPQQTFILNGKTRHRRRRTTTSGCSGCCATARRAPARSTAAASTSARPAPSTSTARRSTPARCRCRRPGADRRGHHDRGAARHRRRRTCTRCRRPGSTATSPQCGYCQPGQIMAAVALVSKVRARGPRDHRRRPRRDPQHLPLRHLHPDPRGRQGRRRAHVAHVKVSTTAAARGSAATATVTSAGPRAVCMSPPVRIACSLSRNRR